MRTLTKPLPSVTELNTDLELVMINDPKLDDGGPDFPELPDDDGRHRGCAWEYGVCTAIPTHYIAMYRNAETDETEAETFCGRHYAATLARFVTVHPVENHCINPPSSHIARYGTIASAQN